MTGCQENKSYSKVLNFLERLDDRIRCTHKETVAVVKPWKDVEGKIQQKKKPYKINLEKHNPTIWNYFFIQERQRHTLNVHHLQQY